MMKSWAETRQMGRDYTAWELGNVEEMRARMMGCFAAEILGVLLWVLDSKS